MYRPVLAGVWQHREIFDGTYTFEDLVDIHEFLDVKDENQSRSVEWQIAEQKRNQHGH